MRIVVFRNGLVTASIANSYNCKVELYNCMEKHYAPIYGNYDANFTIYERKKESMIIKRELQTQVEKLSKDYPVVTIIGPRQSGKTTLAKHTFPEKPYVNLETPAARMLALQDPHGFFSEYPDGCILDEIQKVPQLLSYIQELVDKNSQNIKGQFILTGSHQLELHQAIIESLAGRTALLVLMPLSIAELQSVGIDLSLDEYLLKGFFPRIYRDDLDATAYYHNYVQSYLERDVRQLVNIKNLHTFQRFLQLCVGRIGQVMNAHSLANDVGISVPTVIYWFSVLKASFIIFELQPYFENFGKRAIKSPKIYFTDVGLATYLLGIENIAQLKRDPLRGFLVENLVALELLKARVNRGSKPHLYYYRDNGNHEVDVILKSANQLVPIEIKAAATFHQDFLRGLDFFSQLVKGRCHQKFLIYSGECEQKLGETKILNYKNTAKLLQEVGVL